MVDTEKLTKLYYSIGEVADMFDVSASLIRYWESEFNYLRPQKNSKGDRRFTKQNVDQLNLIYHLVKVKGYTLDGAKRELKEIRRKQQQKQKLLKKLKDIRKGLGKLQKEF